MVPTPEESKVLEELEESVKALRQQFENKHAFVQDVDEAAQLVETDIKRFRGLFQKR